MLTPDQQRVKQLLSETITLLCKNGLHFRNEFCINALIGITLDQHDVFLVTINETVYSGDTFVRNHGHMSAADISRQIIRGNDRYGDISSRYPSTGERYGVDRRDYRSDNRHHADLVPDDRFIGMDIGLGHVKSNVGDRNLGSDGVPVMRCRSLKSNSIESHSLKRSDSRSSHSDSVSVSGVDSKVPLEDGKYAGRDRTKSPDVLEKKHGKCESLKKNEDEIILTNHEKSDILPTAASSVSGDDSDKLADLNSSPTIASVEETSSRNKNDSIDKPKTANDCELENDTEIEMEDSETYRIADGKGDLENVSVLKKESRTNEIEGTNDDDFVVKVEKIRQHATPHVDKHRRSSSVHSDILLEDRGEIGNLEMTGSWQSVGDLNDRDDNDANDDDVYDNVVKPDASNSTAKEPRGKSEARSREKTRGGSLKELVDGSLRKSDRLQERGASSGDGQGSGGRPAGSRLDFYSTRDHQNRSIVDDDDDDDDRRMFIKQEPGSYYSDTYADGRNNAHYRGFGRSTPIGQILSSSSEGFGVNKKGISTDHSQRMIGDNSSSPASMIGGYSRYSGGGESVMRGSGSLDDRRDSTYDIGSPNYIPAAGGRRSHDQSSSSSLAAAAAAGIASPGRGGMYFSGGARGYPPDRDVKMGILPGTSQAPYFSGGSTPGGGGLGAYEDALHMRGDSGSQWANRRQRATFTPYQIDRLESTFNKSRYVGTAERAELSRELNINENIIQVWFQNRRQKLKKQMTARTGYPGDGFHGDSMMKVDFDVSSYMAEQLGRSGLGAGGSGGAGYDYQDSGRDDGSRGAEDDSGQEGGLNGGDYSN